MKFVMDASSILSPYLHTRDEESGEDVIYRGKKHHIPDYEICLERFQATINNLGIPPAEFIVVKDPKNNSHVTRRNIYPQYKIKKDDRPKKFHDNKENFFNAAVQWLKSEGAVVATPPAPAEADDLIAEISNRFTDDVTVWTRDKDALILDCNVLLQGVGGVAELNPSEFPVEKRYIRLYRTIVTGDQSDNIGSCKGFGPATWNKMVAKYGERVIKDLNDLMIDEQLSNLEADVDDFTPFKMIVDQAPELYQYYKVMKPIPVSAHKVKWEGGVKLGNDCLVTAGNFQQVYDYIKSLKFDYAVIDYESDVCQASRDWSAQSGVKVDVMGQEICGMGLRINTENFYFSVDHRDTDNISLNQLESVLELLWGKRIYAHNASFEQTLTYNHFGVFLPNVEDTMLMANYVDENNPLGLKYLSSKHLGLKQTSYDQTLNGRSGMREVSGEEVLRYGLDDVVATDGIMNLFTAIMEYENTLDVFKKVENNALYFTTKAFVEGVDFDRAAFNELKQKNDYETQRAWAQLSDMLLDLDWEGGEFEEVKSLNIGTLNKIYKTIHGKDLPDVSTAKMAIRMMDDRQLAELAKDRNFKEINDYYRKHWKPVAEFNIRSPKQMSKLLYEVLKIPVRIRNTPTDTMLKKASKNGDVCEGNPATDETAIQNAIAWGEAGEYEDLLRLLLKYKGHLTKESLFLDKYPRYVHWKTGKIHASLRQSSTTTRRFTCSAPNLQQLPKRAGKEYRNMLKARKGYTFYALDFTGQELRIAADDSRDPDFLSCYIGDTLRDPHSLTGLRIAQKSGEVLHDYHDFVFLVESGSKKMVEYRTLGKKINFTAQYGAMAPKVAHTLCINEAEAQDYLDAREDAFPTLKNHVGNVHREARNKKFARTLMGGRRHLNGIKHYRSKESRLKQAADRLSYSMRIQGSAAEMTKLVMGEMYRQGCFNNDEVIPSMQIHDELVVQIKDGCEKRWLPVLVEIMCQPYANMIVPMETTPEAGKSFGSLNKVNMEELTC